jgi:REP element-mobilizing transposase RayT
MARPIRIEFEGAVYHVMARGNERRAIFFGDADRKLFLETVGEMVGRFGVRVLAYCLMPNHYHLVVGTPRGNLSAAVGWLQLTYTTRLNARHRRSGHLFQGRFKAVVVEADEYGRWLVEYVHLNPVRPARRKPGTSAPLAVERAAELDGFEWSSHRDYAGLRKRAAEWLCLDWLGYWGKTSGAAHRAYRAEIGRWFAGAKANPWVGLRSGLVLGGEGLWEKVRGIVEGKPGLDETRWTATQAAGALRDRVRALVAGEADERVKIWARVKLGGERPVELAQEFGYRDQSGVGQVIKRLERSAAKQTKLQQLKSQMSSVKS